MTRQMIAGDSRPVAPSIKDRRTERGESLSITGYWCRACGLPMILLDGSDIHPTCEFFMEGME
ncbi:hypothetical protein [Brevibacterium moorei]|uniref:hypothetical protein n=1 Tax=Brevibacterium moorei TaxID=2968457 RepID=UPI00211C7D44|nr:hypothetical protein [Brevibacterium sp. 68QC2CO]MCQ9385145.1 hypothetical protein [Brevibacterium sp. 68QC2CO]